MYKICLFLFIIFNVACALSPNLGALIAFRFFAGVMGSCPITIGTGTIADLLPAEKRAGAMSAYIIGVVLGPSIGPIAGGYLTPAAGWRWTFWLMAVCSGVLFVVAVLFVQESYPYVLLERKTKRLRKETGNTALRSKLDTGKTPRELFAFSIFRPLKMLLSPIVFSLSLYAAVVYAYLYLCFTTFETVFGGQYDFSSGEAGLATLGLGIGAIIGTLACGAIGERSEYRLPPMVIGALFMPVGLFWYGWSAQAKTHWIVPILGTGFIGASMCMIYVSTIRLHFHWPQANNGLRWPAHCTLSISTPSTQRQ
jgi:multidrug resistance protein